MVMNVLLKATTMKVLLLKVLVVNGSSKSQFIGCLIKPVIVILPNSN